MDVARSVTPNKSTKKHPKIVKTGLPWFEEEIKEKKKLKSPAKTHSTHAWDDVYELPEVHPEVELELVACEFCTRQFGSERIEQHRTICETNSKKVVKRPVFNSKRARLKGTEFRRYNNDQDYLDRKGNKLSSKKSSSGSTTKDGEKPKWQIEHETLVQNMRSTKKTSGSYSTNNAPEPKVLDDGRVECPYCGRKFVSTSAEKHIPSCAEQALREKIKKRNQEQEARAQSRAEGLLNKRSKTPMTSDPKRSKTSLGMVRDRGAVSASGKMNGRGTKSRVDTRRPGSVNSNKTKSKSSSLRTTKRNLGEAMNNASLSEKENKLEIKMDQVNDVDIEEEDLTALAASDSDGEHDGEELDHDDDDNQEFDDEVARTNTKPQPSKPSKESKGPSKSSTKDSKAPKDSKSNPKSNPKKTNASTASTAKTPVKKSQPKSSTAKSAMVTPSKEARIAASKKSTPGSRRNINQTGGNPKSMKSPTKRIHGSIKNDPKNVKNRPNRPSREASNQKSKQTKQTTMASENNPKKEPSITDTPPKQPQKSITKKPEAKTVKPTPQIENDSDDDNDNDDDSSSSSEYETDSDASDTSSSEYETDSDDDEEESEDEDEKK